MLTCQFTRYPNTVLESQRCSVRCLFVLKILLFCVHIQHGNVNCNYFADDPPWLDKGGSGTFLLTSIKQVLFFQISLCQLLIYLI